jgi:hypothetical protein
MLHRPVAGRVNHACDSPVEVLNIPGRRLPRVLAKASRIALFRRVLYVGRRTALWQRNRSEDTRW